VVLSRGYGGRLEWPVEVDPDRHSAAEVGDEPLMMARSVPVVVAKDRVAGAALAMSRRASVIVMDDGFQNPALAKDVSLIVIDAARGIGNGRVIPAGPLRAPLSLQCDRTDALLIVGAGSAADAVAARITSKGGPVLRGHFAPDPASVDGLRGRSVLAFAGIGDPDRFFATLRASGIEVAVEWPFPDHHPFSADDIAALLDRAQRDGLRLVTTEKDLARLGVQPRLAEAGLTALPVTMALEDPSGFRRFVIAQLSAARDRRFRGNRR
jgi:tetraacyldisaccharide 4'-kinase